MNVSFFLESKNEYTEHLVDTLTPYIYEGITSIYKEAVRIAKESNKTDKTLMIFQKLLQSISGWNQIRIEEETDRIKKSSGTSEYLDDLIKAVIKSNIILLTYANTVSNVIAQNFYNTFKTSTFILRCYMECGKDAHNNPYLFFHEIDPLDYKRNQIIVHSKIQSGITRAIRKVLPIHMILKEYLINTVNIVQEPPNVELLNYKSQIVEKSEKITKTKSSESKIEQKVMEMIKTENGKSDKDKIRAIMNIDKIITSSHKQDKPESSKRSSQKRSVSSKMSLNFPIVTESQHSFHQTDNLLNIDIDNEETEVNTNFDNVSNTSMTGRGMPSLNQSQYNEVSERIDPSKVKFIEMYNH